MTIIGLERGLKEFRTLIKPNGYLAFTEMCWFTTNPAQEITAYMDSVYSDIKSVDEVRRMALASGYTVTESFNLPASAWRDDYYTPRLERVQELKVENAGVAEAEAIYENCELEVEMSRRHSDSYGYTFFVLQNTSR